MNQGNSAVGATMANMPAMAGIAAGSVHLALGLGRAIDAASDALYDRRYNSSLEAAHAHAYEMEGVAREAMKIIAKLEAENNSLRAACKQRSEFIERLKS